MSNELSLVEEYEYRKWLVDANINTCNHEVTYDDYCLICKVDTLEKKGDKPL